MRNPVRLITCSALLLVLVGCAGGPLLPRAPREHVSVSPELQQQMDQRYNRFLAQLVGGIYPDPRLNAYVDGIGRQLVRGWPFGSASLSPDAVHFAVANTSIPTIYSSPGGLILISRELMLELVNEAQLAAVLAHELGHLAAGHQLVSRFALVSRDNDTLTAAGDYPQLLSVVKKMSEDIVHRAYRLAEEREADRIAIDLLARAGYPLTLTDGVHHPSEDRRQAGVEYIARAYPAYRSSKGLADAEFDARLVLLRSAQGAYEYHSSARQAEALGDSATAIEQYHRAIQLAPHGLLLSALGTAYLRAEDIIPARRYLRQAVSVDPAYYQSRMGSGYLHLLQRHYEEAVVELEASLDLLPTVQAVYLLAEAEEGRKNPVRARGLYQLVVEVDGRGALGQSASSRLRQLPR